MKVKIFLWQLDRQISNVQCYDFIWSGKNVYIFFISSGGRKFHSSCFNLTTSMFDG
jgi:hypothetical protein